MDFIQFKQIVLDNSIFKTGEARGAIRFQDTPNFMRATYDLSAAEHIYYQELGFTHWITKQLVDKNQYYISKKTVGALERAQATGETSNKKPDQEALNTPKHMVQTGTMMKQRG